MPIWQPRACTAAISAAILWMKMASMPKPLPAARASPEILRRTLLYMSELSIARLHGVWAVWLATAQGPPSPPKSAQSLRRMLVKSGLRWDACGLMVRDGRRRLGLAVKMGPVSGVGLSSAAAVERFEGILRRVYRICNFGGRRLCSTLKDNA